MMLGVAGGILGAVGLSFVLKNGHKADDLGIAEDDERIDVEEVDVIEEPNEE